MLASTIMNSTLSGVWLRRAVVAALALAPLYAIADFGKTLALSRFRPSSVPAVGLASALEALRRSSEPVVVAPSGLSTDVFVSLSDRSGSAERTLVDPDGYARVIEIARGGSRDSVLGTWKVADERRVEGFTVRALVNPSPRLNRQDLVSTFRQGEVQVNQGPAGSTGSPCSWIGGTDQAPSSNGQYPWFSREKFGCRPEPDGFVGVVIAQDQRGLARRCIWAWPQTNAVRIVWANASAGGSVHISGGVPRGFEHLDCGIELRLFSGDKLLGERRFPNRRGFSDFDIPTPTRAEGASELTLEVSQKREATSPVCFEASIR